MLEQERAFYQAHLDEWLQCYSNRFVLVHHQDLVGVFNTVEEALSEGARHFGLTPFLVRQVTPTQAQVKIPALTLGVLGARQH